MREMIKMKMSTRAVPILVFLILTLLAATGICIAGEYQVTGAMETHSEIMLRIEAKRGINGQPLRLVAWDPTIEPPPIKREHGKEIDLSTIYVFLPLQERKNKLTTWNRVKELLRLA